MSIILGINTFHAGASAGLVVDGKIVYAAAEERLNRIKYYAGFPRKAIEACLKHAKINFSDIDHVAVGRDSSANRSKKVEYVIKNPLLLGNLLKIKSSRKAMDDIKTLFGQHCGVDPDSLRFQQHNVEHHLAHTASAFFISNWDSCAGITIDGSGDFVTCMMSRCEGDEITPVHRIYVPNSLGSFYTMICQFIGYTRYGDEGKVMGLAPLGKDTYRDTFRDMIAFEKGQIKLNPKFFLPFGKNQGMKINEDGTTTLARHFSDTVIDLFGQPRERGSEITQRDMDLAFCLQQRFEEIYFDLFNHLHALVPHDHVAMAGGCALNSVANGKLFQQTPFKDTCIQPAAGDEGLALGAALYVSRSVLHEKPGAVEFTPYLGGSNSEAEIKAALDEAGLNYRRLERDALIENNRRAHSARQGGRLVSRSQRMGPARAGQSLNLVPPRLSRYEGHPQRAY